MRFREFQRPSLLEGWMKHGDSFSAEVSDLSHHMRSGQSVRCPSCRNPLPPFHGSKGFMKPVEDEEGEVLEWAGKCPNCGANLKVFND